MKEFENVARALAQGLGTQVRAALETCVADGAAYQWRVTGPDGKTLGPYSFTVDLSATNSQDGDSSGPVGVALASGFAHYTWQTHAMEAASGTYAIGLDYTPANAAGVGTPGVPASWRLVVPGAAGWDQLRLYAVLQVAEADAYVA